MHTQCYLTAVLVNFTTSITGRCRCVIALQRLNSILTSLSYDVSVIRYAAQLFCMNTFRLKAIQCSMKSQHNLWVLQIVFCDLVSPGDFQRHRSTMARWSQPLSCTPIMYHRSWDTVFRGMYNSIYEYRRVQDKHPQHQRQQTRPALNLCPFCHPHSHRRLLSLAPELHARMLRYWCPPPPANLGL